MAQVGDRRRAEVTLGALDEEAMQAQNVEDVAEVGRPRVAEDQDVEEDEDQAAQERA